MKKVFSRCVLQGPATDHSACSSALHRSLLYQCSRIGIQYQSCGFASNSQASHPPVYNLTVDQRKPIPCTVSAWTDDPLRGGAEASMQAASGLMSIHGRASGQLQALGLPYLSVLTATLAMQGMMAGAVGSFRGLNNTQLNTSMIQAGLIAAGQYLAGATATDEADNFLAGSANSVLRPPFVSKDGVVFELETLKPEPWQHFCSNINVSSQVASQSWRAFVLRYATARSDMPEELVQAINRFTYSELLSICQKSHVYICRQQTLTDYIHDSEGQTLWRQGPWVMSQPTTSVPVLLPPLMRSALPLQGITVIESCRRIQGPLAGHLLACLGANVIRVEPPGGDPLRLMPPIVNGCSARFDALNRLKQVRILDIKSEQGKNSLRELVCSAHVFLHNWAPGKAAELGLDDSDLCRLNPGLIYACASGWNFENNSILKIEKKTDLPGTDFMVQAFSGIADQIASSSNIRGGSLFTVLDILGGAIAAQAVTAALLQRCLTGQGARVDSSLLSAATLLVADQFEQSLSAPNHLPVAKHWHVVSKTNDGVICIECINTKQIQDLAVLLDIDTDSGEQNIKQLKALINQCAFVVFPNQSTLYWTNKIHSIGIIACEVVDDLKALSLMPCVQACINIDHYSQVNSPWSFNQ